jgi:hypothetical protein
MMTAEPIVPRPEHEVCLIAILRPAAREMRATPPPNVMAIETGTTRRTAELGALQFGYTRGGRNTRHAERVNPIPIWVACPFSGRYSVHI